MKRSLIFLASFFVGVGLSGLLVSALPGHFHLDETKVQQTSEKLSWFKSWDYPDKTLFQVIFENLGHTVALQSLSFLAVLFFSFIICLIALRWVRILPFVESILAIGISAPSLFWIPLLVYFLSLKWQVLPLRFEPNLAGWALPLLALTLRPLCICAEILLTEWKMAESQSYFLVARSKGLSRMQVFVRHGLKNALIPFSSQIGSFMVQSLMGSVLVESLFSVPGIGLLFVQSLQNRDLPVVLFLTVLFTFIILCVHAAVEVFQRKLEPRSERAYQ